MNDGRPRAHDGEAEVIVNYNAWGYGRKHGGEWRALRRTRLGRWPPIFLPFRLFRED